MKGSAFGNTRFGRIVSSGFWPKVKETFGRIPFLEHALAAYYCATDPATPSRVRLILLGALAYFVMPFDLVPDFMAFLGYTDDATVLAMAVQTVRAYLKPEHYEKAHAALNDKRTAD